MKKMTMRNRLTTVSMITFQHRLKAIRKGVLTAGLAGLLALGMIAFVPDDSVAQNGDPLPPPNLPAKPMQTPIDGGLTLLAAAGGGYAIKKLRDKRK